MQLRWKMCRRATQECHNVAVKCLGLEANRGESSRVIEEFATPILANFLSCFVFFILPSQNAFPSLINCVRESFHSFLCPKKLMKSVENQ